MELTEQQKQFVKRYIEFANIKAASEAVGIDIRTGCTWFDNKKIKQSIEEERVKNLTDIEEKKYEKFKLFYTKQFDEDFESSLKLLNDYTKSIAPKENLTYNIFFSKDWQTDLICRRYVQIEEILQEFCVTDKEDLIRRLKNSDKLGEALEKEVK